MPAIIPAIAAELANGARDALRQGANVLTGNQGNYIANGDPQSIYGKIQQETARQACRRYADDPAKFSGAAAVAVENACRPYLDDIGYGGQPTIKLPFRGGQCNATYRVFASFTTFATDGSVSGSGTADIAVTGPVGGLTFSNSGCGPTLGPLAPGAQGFCCFITAGGVTQLFIGDGNGGVTANITSVVPENPNLPDCGNPPPDVVIPPNPTPGPRREPFNPSPDIDIDIDVEINPDLTIDVDFGTGPITIDPFGDGGGGGGGGGGVGDPGTPQDTGQGGAAEGEAPDGQILTGLRIDFVEPPIGGNEYAPGVFRAVCYIYMGTADGLDHDPAGAMLKSGQFVYAEKDFLTRWSVAANAGYNLRVTPYYRAAEAEG